MPFFYWFGGDQYLPSPNFRSDVTLTGIGRHLAECRKRRMLIQVSLAMRCGVSPEALSRYETGAARPSVATLCRPADGLDVSVDYLVGRTDVRLAHRASALGLTKRTDLSAKRLVRLLLDLPQRMGLPPKEFIQMLLSGMAVALKRSEDFGWAGDDPQPSQASEEAERDR